MNIGGDGGPATNAVVQPLGVALDPAGNLYVAEDLGGGTISFISEVTPDGIISTIVGSTTPLGLGYSGDGGPATSAQVYFTSLTPVGIAVDSTGNLYFTDTANQRVRRVSPDGVIKTVAGGGTPSVGLLVPSIGDGGPATGAVLGQPTGVAVDPAGNLYIVDALFRLVRKVGSDGTITTVAGCLGPSCTFTLGDGGPATSATLMQPVAVAVSTDGSLYIADAGNNRIRKVSTDGTISTVAGSTAGSFQGDGGPATSAGLYQPKGVAVDPAGNIFIDDSGDYRIRMVTPDGTISTIAGTGAVRQFGDSSGDSGPATSARLGYFTSGIAVGAGGTLYIADPVYGVRLLTPAPQ